PRRHCLGGVSHDVAVDDGGVGPCGPLHRATLPLFAVSAALGNAVRTGSACTNSRRQRDDCLASAQCPAWRAQRDTRALQLEKRFDLCTVMAYAYMHVYP